MKFDSISAQVETLIRSPKTVIRRSRRKWWSGVVAFAQDRLQLIDGEELRNAISVDDTVKAALLGNGVFKNRFEGKRAVIIGNGPSLSTIDVESLKDEITFAVSGFWKHEKASVVAPKFYAFADPIFFQNVDPDKREFFARLTDRVRDTTYWVPYDAQPAVKDEGLLPESRTHYAHLSREMRSILKRAPDFTEGVPRVINVVHLCILLALYMGFTRIILLGVDHDWLAHRGNDRHFYEGKTLANNTAAHGDLSRYSYKELMKSSLRLWEDYEILGLAARRTGVRILNATPGGFLDIFDRQNLNDLLLEKNSNC